MTTALTNSVNTYWAQVGEQLGTETMFEYMERFGFDAGPRARLPGRRRWRPAASSTPTASWSRESFDVGRVAIGQGGAEGQLLATADRRWPRSRRRSPTTATLMEPTFLQEAKDPDGRTIEELDPDEQSEVISEEAANQLDRDDDQRRPRRAPRRAQRRRRRRSPARPAPPRSTSRAPTSPGSSASPRPTTRRSRSRRWSSAARAASAARSPARSRRR